MDAIWPSIDKDWTGRMTLVLRAEFESAPPA